MNMHFVRLFCLSVPMLLLSCNKEAPAPDQLSALEAAPKHNFVTFLEHQGQCLGQAFRVWKGCHGCYGQIHTGDGPDCTTGYVAFIEGYDFPDMWTSGTCQLDPSHCEFERGPNSTTAGPTYLIVPPCGGSNYVNRAKLRIRFFGHQVIDPAPGCAWFTYSEASNTWSAASGASTFFQWSVMTTPPQDCCLPG